MTSTRLKAITAAFTAGALLVAACGSSKKAEPAATTASAASATTTAPAAATATTTAGAGSGQSLQDIAKAKVAEWRKGPSTYPGPTEAFKVVPGKASVIFCGAGAPICKVGGDQAVEALTAMGWTTGPAVDGAFDPKVSAAFLDRAVADKLDGVIMVSIDLNTIPEATQRAIDAGIKITCTQCVSGDKWTKQGVLDVTVDFAEQGVVAAWTILATVGDEAKVHGFVSKEFQSAVNRQDALVATLTKECPKCKVTIDPFSPPDIAKPGPPQFSALLAANPKGTLSFMVGHYDGFALAAAKTEKNAGRTDIPIAGYDGNLDALQELASNNPPMTFVVAEAYMYSTWAAADLLGRIKAKLPLWTGYDKMGSTLIDSTNVQQYLDQKPDNFPGPPNYRENLKKLWLKA